MPLALGIPAYVLGTVASYSVLIPHRSTAGFITWALKNRERLLDFPLRCNNLAGEVALGMNLGVNTKWLGLSESGLLTPTGAQAKAIAEFCRRFNVRALAVGRFLSNAGHVSTIFEVLNVRV